MERLKWPGAALGLAGLAFGLRRWQMATTLDGEGLVNVGAAASVALLALMVGGAALFLRMALLHENRIPVEPEGVSCWDLVFGAADDVIYLGMMLAAALCTGISAPLWMREGLEGRPLRQWLLWGGEGQRWVDSGLLEYLLAVLALGGAVGLLLSARMAYRMCGTGRYNGWLILPVLSGSVWLLELYQHHAPQPSRWLYVPLLLAAVCGVLFYLSCARLSFESGRPRMVLWLGGMTVLFSAIGLADRPDGMVLFLLLGQMLAALAALWTAPGNLTRPPRETWLGRRAAMLNLRMEQPPRRTAYDWQKEASGDAEIQEDEEHV